MAFQRQLEGLLPRALLEAVNDATNEMTYSRSEQSATSSSSSSLRKLKPHIVDDDATYSPTPSQIRYTEYPTSSPTVFWQQTWLDMTYFELYFIGAALLFGFFLFCYVSVPIVISFIRQRCQEFFPPPRLGRNDDSTSLLNRNRGGAKKEEKK